MKLEPIQKSSRGLWIVLGLLLPVLLWMSSGLGKWLYAKKRSTANHGAVIGLPNLKNRELLRGQRYYRVITHFHTIYSFDACDGRGRLGFQHNTDRCLQSLHHAICKNHIDALFYTDHANHMADVPFAELLIERDPKNWILNSKQEPVAAYAHCDTASKEPFQGMIIPGLEGRMMAMGMERHSPEGSDQIAWQKRQDLYLSDQPWAADRLRTETDALIVVPHTESKTDAWIQGLRPDGIEIYNFHANFDPNIRRQYLDDSAFSHLPILADFLLDPDQSLSPDYLFLEFFKLYPVYLDRWNQSIAKGLQLLVVGGTDAHENVFKQKISDDERLDSYRRLTGFMSNWVRSPGSDYFSIKSALKQRQSFWVLEGLGTPSGFDFHAVTGIVSDASSDDSKNQIIEVGGAGEQVKEIVFVTPKFDVENRYVTQPKLIRSELHHIDQNAKETIVASVEGQGQTMIYKNPVAGTYRVHVWMKPTHLRPFVRANFADAEYPWIISNGIKVSDNLVMPGAL
jgi:hypothetical protein